MGFFSIEFLYTLVLMCGSIVFGSIIAYGSASIRYIKIEFGPLSTFEVAAFQSMPAFVAIVAPFLFSALMKRLRRKVVTAIVGFSGMTFWLLLLSMDRRHFWGSILVRGLLGITLAGTSLVCPIYIIEIAPAAYRGFYTSLHPVAIIIGHIVTNLLGVTHKWQPPIYTAATFMAVLGGFVFLIPDSPVDVAKGSSKKEGIDLEEKLNKGEEEGGVDVENEEAKKLSLFDKSMLKNTFIASTVMFLPQLSGIGAIMQNLAPMMSEVGLTFDAGYQATIAISAQLIACLVCSVLIDRLGCKKLWIFSTAGTSTCLLFYALNVKFNWSKWLPMIFLFGYQFFFGIGISSVPWILLPQLFPQELKAPALALGTSLNWVSASIVMFLFPYLSKWFGQFGLMLILMVINVILILFGIFFIKENGQVVPVAIIEEEVGTDDIGTQLIQEQTDELNETCEL